MEDTASARLLAVNVVAQLHLDRGRTTRPTAIDKRPVTGRVAVGELGVAGDVQAERAHHGGPDKAVYAFAREDASHWESELGRPIPPGGFGENLSTTGLEVSDALVGERWRVGSRPDAVVVEVTMPRTPCMTFARWMGEQNRHWVKRFSDHGRVGAYLRVRTPGLIEAGDPITVDYQPSHGVPVGALLRGLDRAEATALMDADDEGSILLGPSVRERIRRAVDGVA